MPVKKQSLYEKFAERFNFADEQKLVSTLKATAFKVKDGEVTDEQMTALLIVADQYGLNPFTKEIYAYPDKQNGIVAVVSVDGWSRMINQHPDMDGMEFIYDGNWITDQPGAKPCPASIECAIYRKGRAHPIKIKEFLDECYRPPFQGKDKTTGAPYFTTGPWQSHTKRMLRHKSLIQCARIAFGFVGIYDEDEAQRIIEGQAVNVATAELEPSAHAKTFLPKLVTKASRDGSWQGALEYVKQSFSGFDVDYLTTELNKAKAAAEATLPGPSGTGDPANAAAQTSGEGQSSPPNGKGPSPLAEAKAALQQ
jgi:phage recombination protein Bet